MRCSRTASPAGYDDARRIFNGLIDKRPAMKRIDVDPQARTARAQGGLTWGEFNDATAEHGLATTGGVISTTGIAELTLG